MDPVRAAVVGCGNISGTYFSNLSRLENVRVIACSDLVMARAQQQADKFQVPGARRYADLLEDPEIEMIINLTVPTAHAEVSLAALRAGKSLYSEKPLATRRKDGRRILREAAKRNLLVGCAPDTFLGGGFQTARKILDEGTIGRPIAASAAMLSRGPEHWHPDPAFFYKKGGGPLLDIGPYYLTALVMLFGPVRRVAGLGKISHPYRTILSEPKKGKQVKVKTPTHIDALLDFSEGISVTLTTSFDIWEAHPPSFQIHGTQGTLRLPDPNTFGGPLFLQKEIQDEPEEILLESKNIDNCRGIGVADMANAIRNGGRHRANGEMAYHVLEIMHAILDSSAKGRHIDLKSSCARPALLDQEIHMADN